MTAITHEIQQASPVSAAKLFKVYVLEGDTILPKILPQVIKSVEILEGSGGSGTIKKTTFADGDGGSINKSVIKYYIKGDGKFDEEKIKAGEEKLSGLVKIIETYILANPDI